MSPNASPLSIELQSARYGTQHAVARDCCRAGVLLARDGLELPLAARVTVRIDLGRVRYRVTATVVHSSAAGVGLMYDDLDAEASAALYTALRPALRPARSGARFPYWLRAAGTPPAGATDAHW